MISQKIRKNKIGRHTMGIHGHTKLVFIDKFGRETVKMDQDNTVTAAVKKIFESNYFGSIDYSMLMPAIKKVLGGVVLFQNTLGNDASDIWIPKSFDNEITAHAGQTVPTSLADDLTRGIPNTAASLAVQNGYKMVWNFPETQGNGTIASVGLCHSDFGDYALNSSDFQPLEMISNNSIKSFSFWDDDSRKKVLNFFDPVGGYSYSIWNNDVNFGASGQSFNNHYTTFNVIRRKNAILNNISVDMCQYYGNEEAEESFTLTYDLGGEGTLTYANLPSIYIDRTNNLLWFSFVSGLSSISSTTVFNAAAFDMSAFANGVNLTPVKTQMGSSMGGAILGGNIPTQGLIKESGDGYLPAVIWDTDRFKFKLASYDDSTQEFSLENTSGIDLGLNRGAVFPENLALGNYFYLHSVRQTPLSKLYEFDMLNGTKKSYDVTAPTEYINPYHIEDNNPIIGAACWGWSPSRGFTMGDSGTAINKLYLATKNDLPASITKSASTAMRVEYTLTYV